VLNKSPLLKNKKYLKMGNIYESSKSLIGKILKKGDTVVFTEDIVCIVKEGCLRLMFRPFPKLFKKFFLPTFGSDEKIFKGIKKNARSFCEQHYKKNVSFAGPFKGSFPRTLFDDYGSLTDVTIALFREYEKLPSTENVSIKNRVPKTAFA